MTKNTTTPSIEDLQRELQAERDRNARRVGRARESDRLYRPSDETLSLPSVDWAVS